MVDIRSYKSYAKFFRTTSNDKNRIISKYIKSFKEFTIYIHVQNEAMLPRCLKQTSKLLSTNEDAFKVYLSGVDFDSANEDVTTDEDELDEEELEDEEESDSKDEGDADDSEDNEISKTKLSKSKGRASEVDDKFFKLSEMEDFLEAEDRKEMLKSSGKLKRKDEDDLVEIDYFKADDDEDGDADDDEDEDYNYENFFGDEQNPEHIHEDDSRDVRRSKLLAKNEKKKKSKKHDLGLEESDVDEDEAEEAEDDDDGGRVKFDLSKNTYRSDSEEDNEEDDEDENEEEYPPKQFNDNNGEEEEEEKSTFEHRQERLRLRIQDMEDQVMGEKSWQLRGEIDSGSRPQNSLLENVLEFDSTVRPAPIITEETTLQLEDIIKQRIKDKAWNDVERKFKPVNTPQEFRKKLVLDQEKSKASLAQIYEQDYLKEVEKLNPNAEEREAEEPKEHKEIRSLMKGIFAQLDALANFSYTPKVAAPEVRIITNTPAINMEEVAPIAVSDAALLAPEEVMPRTKGDEIGKSERSETDKKRERRQKKVKQRQIQAASERKEAEKAAKGIVSSNKAEKKKLLEKVTKSRNVTKVFYNCIYYHINNIILLSI